MMDGGWRMKDEEGFADGQTNRWTLVIVKLL